MQEQEREFNFNMKYFDELKKSMEYLGSKKDTLFIGQAVEVPGTAMSNTLKNIDKKKISRTTCCRRYANGNDIRFSNGQKCSYKYLSKMEFFTLWN